MIKSGLTERDFATISSIFSQYPSVHLVYLFGSRAKGNPKKGSDIDMAIMNTGVTAETIHRIKGDFEESSLPYSVDLVYYPSLTHAEMKEHIDRVHVAIYQK
jgi:predicted nucleotidyltransferase